MKSIIQEEKECFICHTTKDLERHHCLHGTGLRKLADKYGLTVYLCVRHHRGDMHGNDYAVHFNRVFDLKLKQVAQKAFMKKHPDKNFVEIFGKNYL